MKTIRNLMIVIFILAIILIGVGFASGASFDQILDGFTTSDDFILQDPIVYTEQVTSLKVTTETRDIVIESTNDLDITIEHYRLEDEIWIISLVDGMLTITQQDQPGILGWFNWRFNVGEKDDVKIYIPETYAFEIDVMTNTGEINLSGFNLLEDTKLETDTGSINVEYVTTPNLDVSSDTGDIKLLDVTVTNDIILETNTGSLDMDDVSSENLAIDLDTGSIDIDQITANRIDIANDTGSIDINGINLTNRGMNLHTDTGSVIVNDLNQGHTYQMNISNQDFYINAETDTGNIRIKA